MQRPAFLPCFRVEVVESEGVVVLSERGDHVLRGGLYCRLTPLLDGTRTIDEIVDLLPDDPPAHVYYALARLERRGYVAEAVPGGEMPAAESIFWSNLGLV